MCRVWLTPPCPYRIHQGDRNKIYCCDTIHTFNACHRKVNVGLCPQTRRESTLRTCGPDCSASRGKASRQVQPSWHGPVHALFPGIAALMNFTHLFAFFECEKVAATEPYCKRLFTLSPPDFVRFGPLPHSVVRHP